MANTTTGPCLEKITPDYALQLLTMNIERNRPLVTSHVKHLRDDILSGNWRPLEGIIHIDENGKLINGQHRLRAIVAAAKPVDVLVARGVDSSYVDYIDQNISKRSVGHMFRMRGTANANKLAATCNALYWIENGAAPTAVQCNAILGRFSDDAHWAVATFGTARASRDLRRAPIYAAFAYLHAVFPHEMETLAHKLITTQDRHRGCPSIAIESVIMHTASSNTTLRVLLLRKLFRGIKAYVEGQSIFRIEDSNLGYEWALAVRRKYENSLAAMSVSSIKV